MCTPLSGLGLLGKATDRKPLALLAPGLAAMGMGKTKSKSQADPAMSYGG